MYVWVCVLVRGSCVTVVDANLSYKLVWRSQDFALHSGLCMYSF